ncbi:hypothetical protein B0H10DRAFT_1976089 [Mycena sp. CBHHK59/15]|nr:hypothetical protein B0H10DRAFT_1976089 [Mycena sp. CBHHK59/15]
MNRDGLRGRVGGRARMRARDCRVERTAVHDGEPTTPGRTSPSSAFGPTAQLRSFVREHWASPEGERHGPPPPRGRLAHTSSPLAASAVPPERGGSSDASAAGSPSAGSSADSIARTGTRLDRSLRRPTRICLRWLNGGWRPHVTHATRPTGSIYPARDAGARTGTRVMLRSSRPALALVLARAHSDRRRVETQRRERAIQMRWTSTSSTDAQCLTRTARWEGGGGCGLCNVGRWRCSLGAEAYVVRGHGQGRADVSLE